MLRTPALNLIVGISAFSLAGIIMYIWYKNKDDEDELDALDDNLKKSNSKKNLNQKEIQLKMIISNDKIPIIVGRSGANLKSIENKSSTVIIFKEKDDNNQFCEIRGKHDNVYAAKEMLLKEISRSPTVKEEIFVPQSACGKIIGRCGESLQEICRLSLAKVSVESGDRTSGNSTRKIVITGNRNQVNIAKKLIEDKVKEDESYRKNLEETEQKREPRRSPTNSISSNHSSMTSLSSSAYLPLKEKLNPNESEKQPIEVFVSAIASPAKFWLQLIGPQSQKLDELVDNMTKYYNEEDNKIHHKIADPYLGQIVAALFKYDGKWYRAEIVGILPNEYNPRDVVLDLYFVDYGDSEYVAPHEVFELRTDFLTLRFQAVECYLANVKPNLSGDPDMWDPSSIAKFEELTHVASWKKLKSRIITYKERPRGGNHIRREGSPVPGVELFDLIEGTEINIAHMLISHGFAMPDYPETNNDVLRLGGGDFTNFTSSYLTTRDVSYESISNADNNIDDKNVGNGSVGIIGDKSSSNHPFLNGGGGGNNNILNKNSILNNSKTESDKFLQTEKSNGNSVKHNLAKTNHIFS